MQIFYLPDPWLLLLFFILWPAFQLTAMLIANKLPDRFYSTDSFLFQTRGWEDDGKIYDKLFKVKKWKRYLPDGAAVFKRGYKKKHLSDYSRPNLQRYLVESCRAEMTHLLAIFPFWAFGFFAPPIVVFYMFLYSLAVNVPCMIAQRYNRPRFIKLMAKMPAE